MSSIEGRRKRAPAKLERFDIRTIQLRAEPYSPNFDVEIGPRRLSENFKRSVRDALRGFQPDAVLAMLSGQEFQAISLLNHPVRYEFAAPGDNVSIASELQSVPYVVMRAEVRRLVSMVVSVFHEFLGTLYDCPVYQVVPPPPVGDEDHILAYPGPFMEIAATQGVSPAPFRRRMWRLYRDVLREEGDKMGIRTLDCPGVCIEDGYLKPEYRANDPVHGNAKYGHAVFDRVTRIAFPAPKEANA